MSRSVILSVLVAVLAACTVIGPGTATPPTPSPDKCPLVRWEYKSVRGATEKVLNDLGERGWELTGTVYKGMDFPEYILKRPRR